jgi:hydroxypyruvate reductase
MPDASTVADARALAARELGPALPPPVAAVLGDSALAETPKPGDPAFARAAWHCLLDNDAAVRALARELRRHGFVTSIDLTVDGWPIAAAADHLLERLRALAKANPARHVAIVSGGEVNVPVLAGTTERGGRNQHFVAHLAALIAGDPIAVLSAGTDGIDGTSWAAGAVADGTTYRRGRAIGRDAIAACEAFNTNSYLVALGEAVVTGPTGTNVRDVRVLAMQAGAHPARCGPA